MEVAETTPAMACSGPVREPTVRDESVLAPAVRFPKVAPPTAFSCPAMVVEPVESKLVVVAEMVEMPAKREVEEAKRPLCAKSAVEVAEVLTPKFSVGVKGKEAPLPVASVPQERTPCVSALTSQDAALRPETMRAVVEAVPETASAVVEA